MKKLTVLLLAAALLCTCFVLAACGEDETSSPDTSSTGGTSSTDATSSATETSSAAESSEEASSEDTSSEEPAPEPQVFWVTHYNDNTPEGAGVIFTETDTAGGWSTHVAFQPVEGEDNVWEIVEISYGVGTGNGAKLDVPEGGFVYAVNTGNNWPELYANDPDQYASYADAPDYTTAICSNLGGVVMAAWKVGDKFQLDGITYDDMLDGIVPTDTPDVQWWEDGDNDSGHYNCTATFLPVA